MPGCLLFLPYLPNLHWFQNYLSHEPVFIEQHENFIKSTWRNRCEIAGAGGRMNLTIPLEGGRDHHQLYRETKIAYTSAWQHNHWQSILSAYGSAPFFEFYGPKFELFYTKEFPLLFDFNRQLLDVVFASLKLPAKHSFTNIYEKQVTGVDDYRSEKRTAKVNIPAYPRYYQIFEDRNGFISNLSILDLLFHEGPAAINYLSELRIMN